MPTQPHPPKPSTPRTSQSDKPASKDAGQKPEPIAPVVFKDFASI